MDKNPYYKLDFRAVRFPLSENTYECVITNLPTQEFDAETVKKLYGMRWRIETSFRELKYAVGLTSFHAKKNVDEVTEAAKKGGTAFFDFL